MSSSFMTDLNGIYTTGLENAAKVATHNVNSRQGQDLEMGDFMNLMVESLKNQTIDNQVELSDMMNQMVQMSVMTAISNINQLITESTNLSYAASLVGKEVTIAQRLGSQVSQIRGTVTGTGLVNGQQAVFVGDKSYWLSDIMAVGRLPGEESGEKVSESGESSGDDRDGGYSGSGGGSFDSGFQVTDAEPEGT